MVLLRIGYTYLTVKDSKTAALLIECFLGATFRSCRYKEGNTLYFKEETDNTSFIEIYSDNNNIQDITEKEWDKQQKANTLPIQEASSSVEDPTAQ